MNEERNIDVLEAGVIEALLPEGHGLRVQVERCVTSTNTLLCEAARAGEAEGLVLCAQEQSAGRGRRGRSFFSPPDTGLYMSVLLRPDMAASLSVKITAAAAVAVCEALEAVGCERPQIKWVNDVFVDGRKVCGILTEGALVPGTDRLAYAVLGVGINVYAPPEGFPQELSAIAGHVCAERKKDLRSHIAARFLSNFMVYYKRLEENAFLEAYRARSLAPGHTVDVIAGDMHREALALGIDEDCRLLVRYGDGTEDALSSGEISIRLRQE